MAIMFSKTYAALKEAGVSDSKAQAAAEEIAGFVTRLTRLEVLSCLTFAVVITIAAKVWGL